MAVTFPATTKNEILIRHTEREREFGQVFNFRYPRKKDPFFHKTTTAKFLCVGVGGGW